MMHASTTKVTAQHGVAADRFAREIGALLKRSDAARLRRLNANPLGRASSFYQAEGSKPKQTCGARAQQKAFNTEHQLSRVASRDTSQETGYASPFYLSNAEPRFCKGLKMDSQLRDQLHHTQPIVEAARELVEAVQPWLQAPADFDPFSPTPNYPTWELDKHSFG